MRSFCHVMYTIELGRCQSTGSQAGSVIFRLEVSLHYMMKEITVIVVYVEEWKER